MSSAIAQAAKLKPEIRLAQSISDFGASLDESKRATFKTYHSSSPPLPRDVIRITEEINHDGARAHKSWRPYGTRLVTILERIQMFAHVGDILVGGAQNMIASGVWATVRLSLTIATGALSYFDKLSSLLMRLGRDANITSNLTALYPRDAELQSMMCEYLIVITNFCKKIVAFTQKSRISQLTSAYTISYESDFKTFEADLQKWAFLIEKKVNILTTQSQLETGTLVRVGRNLALGASEKKKKETLRNRKAQLLAKLCPDQASFELTWRRQRKKGSAQWIFGNEQYLAWERWDQSRVLWVHGKLGSGKTVLLANVVGRLLSRSPPETGTQNKELVICSFFCQYSKPKTLRARSILGSIARQLVSALDDNDNILKTLTKKHLDFLSGELLPEDVTEVIEHVTDGLGPWTLVIDGLDECVSQSEVLELTRCLNRLLKTTRLRLLFSTRTDSEVTKLMSEDVSLGKVALSETVMTGEMAAFVDQEFERRRHIRKLDPSVEELVKRVLVTSSNGMYLWVTLQLDVIFPKYNTKVMSDADIIDLVENLPEGLPAAFDRALAGIQDCRYGRNIFAIVGSAARPLHIDELRIALNIVPGETLWDLKSLPTNGQSLLGLCSGSLLELDEETETVFFIHNSALQHLLTHPSSSSEPKYFFNADEAEDFLAGVCITYLCLNVFETQLAVPRKLVINSDRLGQKISETTTVGDKAIYSGFSRLTRSIARPTTSNSSLDIARLLESMQPNTRSEEVYMFLDYVQEYWPLHAANLDYRPYTSQKVLALFDQVMQRTPSHAKLPWNNISGSPGLDVELQWALKYNHAERFESILSRLPRGEVREGTFGLLSVLRGISRGIYAPLNDCRSHEPSVLSYALEYLMGCNRQELPSHEERYMIAKELLRKGADANHSCMDGISIFKTAVDLGLRVIANLLLDFGACPPSREPNRSDNSKEDVKLLEWLKAYQQLDNRHPKMSAKPQGPDRDTRNDDED